MKVVGLSGAQGGGKSSMLLELKNRGWQLDSFRVSRAVQAQLGWESLERVMDSPETMMQFQNEVFRQKYQNDLALARNENTSIILTERTFADIAAYTAHWSWKFFDLNQLTLNQVMEFLQPYVQQCATAQQEVYAGTMLLPLMEHVVWEDDPNRAKRDTAEAVFEDIRRFMELKLPVHHRCFTITEKTVAARADQVVEFLETL